MDPGYVAPVVVVVNGDEVRVEAGSSVADLLIQLGLGEKWVLVERNAEPVRRADLATTGLAPNDRIELVRAVAGG
ncbi:MAG: sulfur carrier protein [Actinomycetota bacterium]|nr:sulfur carrier protein [Actinomycetota bacterium]